MNDEGRMKGVIARLEQRFPANEDHWLNDPFRVLVATILSQHTSDRNSHRAFLRLAEAFDIRSEVLARLKPAEIQPAIELAGLSTIKSHRIVEVSKEVLKRFDGDLSRVFRLSFDDARGALLDIKGIGPKTADVLLSFGGYPVMPVDTNIFRVVNRIGFVKGSNYERTRGTLEKLIPSGKRGDMHLYFIRLGREICKPRNPLCQTCPLNVLCDYGLRKE